MTTRAHGWPHCDCAACMQRRYDETGDVIHSALSHDTPSNLSSVRMIGMRPLSESDRRALLGPVRHRTKVQSEFNGNR